MSDFKVIRPAHSDCEACKQRVATYLKSIAEWKAVNDKLEAELAQCREDLVKQVQYNLCLVGNLGHAIPGDTKCDFVVEKNILAEFIGKERDAIKAELAQVKRERDLAVAHDTQPYPTAWAYEQACNSLKKHKDALRVARESLSKIRNGMTTQQEHVERLTKAEAHDAIINIDSILGGE